MTVAMRVFFSWDPRNFSEVRIGSFYLEARRFWAAQMTGAPGGSLLKVGSWNVVFQEMEGSGSGKLHVFQVLAKLEDGGLRLVTTRISGEAEQAAVAETEKTVTELKSESELTKTSEPW